MKRPQMVIALLVVFAWAGSRAYPGTAQEPAQPLPAAPEAGERRIAQTDPEVEVPGGTILPIVLSAYLNTHNTQVGDTFYAETIYPIYIQQRLALPRGSTIRGTVTEVVRPGKIRGKGRIAVRFDDILLPNGVRRVLVASFRGIHGPGDEKVDRQAEKIETGGSQGTDVGQIIGSSSQGAIIGAISGGGKGAGIGAGAGAAVGLATILFTRGRDLVLEPGTQFELEIRQPLRFAYGELEFSAAEMNSGRGPASPRPGPRNQGNPRRGRFSLPGWGGFPIPR
jgi:hypothetical protein